SGSKTSCKGETVMIYICTQRWPFKHLLGLTLVSAGLLAWTALLPGHAGLAIAQTANPSWTFTGSLNTGRVFHTATLLPNGKVLVTGGQSRADLDSAELYDPATGTCSFTGTLNAPQSLVHTGTMVAMRMVLF